MPVHALKYMLKEFVDANDNKVFFGGWVEKTDSMAEIKTHAFEMDKMAREALAREASTSTGAPPGDTGRKEMLSGGS